jgi:hypothetical protein
MLEIFNWRPTGYMLSDAVQRRSYGFDYQAAHVRSRVHIAARSNDDGNQLGTIIGVVGAVVVGIILLFTIINAIRRRRRRLKSMRKGQTPLVEAPERVTTSSVNQLDVENQYPGSLERSTTRLGEVYTIEGPKQELRLAYHQELPRHLTDFSAWPPGPIPSDIPEPIRGSHSGDGLTSSSTRAHRNWPGQAEPVELTPGQTTTAILALQEELQRLRAQIPQLATSALPVEDPFNPI